MLELQKVSKNFGGVAAVSGVSMKIERGQIHGLIGPNGAGKTTVFKLISKVLKPNAGRIVFNGAVITHLPSYRVSLAGIGYVFQDSLLFSDMSLFENMLVSGSATVNHGLLSLLPFYQVEKDRQLKEKAREILELFGMDAKAELLPQHLSHGEKRRALIARALMNEASLLLLDEPSAGMNATEREKLSKDILEIRKRGCTIFIIEHNLRLIMGICDYISVLNFGRVISQGTAKEVSNDEAVIEAYIGKKND